MRPNLAVSMVALQAHIPQVVRKKISSPCPCVVPLKHAVAMRKQENMPRECPIPGCSATPWVLNIKTHLARCHPSVAPNIVDLTEWVVVSQDDEKKGGRAALSSNTDQTSTMQKRPFWMLLGGQNQPLGEQQDELRMFVFHLPSPSHVCPATGACFRVPLEPLHSGGSPNKGGQNWKWLSHPCLLGGPQGGGNAVGGNAMSPLHSGGSPNKGGQNQKWVPHPCLLGGPKEGGNAMSPLHSQGSLAKGTKSKVAALGARTKLWMCSPKEYHLKIFRKNGVSASKNTLNPPPPQPFLKKGEFSKTPHAIGFLRTPPPLADDTLMGRTPRPTQCCTVEELSQI